MEYKFNINYLKHGFADRRIKLISEENPDMYNLHAWDLNTFWSVLKQVQSISPEYEKRYAKTFFEPYVLEEYVGKFYQNQSDLKKYLYKLEIIPYVGFFDLNCKPRYKKMTLDRTVSLALKSLSKENEIESKHLEELIDKGNVCIDDSYITENKNAKGFEVSVLEDRQELIYVLNTDNVKTSYSLVHELGHASQHQLEHDVFGALNYHFSLLSETYAYLKQLIFIDNMQNEINKKDLKNLKKTFINNFYLYFVNVLKEDNVKIESVKSVYSYLLAFYFFKLYKENKQIYTKTINEFNELIYFKSDKEILNELGIKVSDLKEGLEYYKVKTKKYKRDN